MIDPKPCPKRDFLRLADLSLDEHRSLFARARALKAARNAHQVITTLAGRSLLLLFEKSSTRTRVSFEAAIQQLGGSAITLPMQDSQLARGEPLDDTARVVSRYADAVMFRTFGDERLATFAAASRVPVINGLSDGGHPVQILADLLTIIEHLGPQANGPIFPDSLEVLRGKQIAWIGDAASNMALSWIEAAFLFGFTLRIAAPEGYQPSEIVIAKLSGLSKLSNSVTGAGAVKLCTAQAAATGADVVSTDVWISMGQEKEAAARRKTFEGYCVDAALMQLAQPKAIFLHCLPAHRGEEVTAEVIDGEQSAILDEAENRLHVQKALLELMILGQLPV